MFVGEWSVRFADGLQDDIIDGFKFLVRRRTGTGGEYLGPDGVVRQLELSAEVPDEVMWTLPDSVMTSFLNELWSRGIRPSNPSLDTENSLLRGQVDYMKGLLDKILPRALRAEAKE
jgi:hypothetical protein